MNKIDNCDLNYIDDLLKEKKISIETYIILLNYLNEPIDFIDYSKKETLIDSYNLLRTSLKSSDVLKDLLNDINFIDKINIIETAKFLLMCDRVIISNGSISFIKDFNSPSINKVINSSNIDNRKTLEEEKIKQLVNISIEKMNEKNFTIDDVDLILELPSKYKNASKLSNILLEVYENKILLDKVNSLNGEITIEKIEKAFYI